MKRLQAEWKTIGPVRRNKSEDVWNRFRAAADKFFERYHNRHQIALAGKLAEREAMVVELETLAAADGGQPPADLAARVQQLRTTWNRSVPIPGAGDEAARRSLAGGARADRRAHGPTRSRARISIRPPSGSGWRSSWRASRALLNDVSETTGRHVADRGACRAAAVRAREQRHGRRVRRRSQVARRGRRREGRAGGVAAAGARWPAPTPGRSRRASATRAAA